MKFCVIGDSWSTEQFSDIEQIFTVKNHSVVNISRNGASNFGQLRTLRYQVLDQGSTDFDYIVWFHTEPARDFTEFVSLDFADDKSDSVAGSTQFPGLTRRDFYKDLEHIESQNYAYAQQLYNQYRIPFIVIGGAGPLHYPANFDFVSWSLTSWNQEVSGIDFMPVNCYHTHVTLMLSAGNYNRQEVLEEIDRLDQLESVMRSRRDLYPDETHIAKELYPALVNRILESIN
jgi:hypothetical protein